MPGPEALRRQEYYGYPQNHFWKILPQIYGEGELRSYSDKLDFLKRYGIALWDVIASCEREGAADQKIRKHQPNNIPALLKKFPKIEKIFLNGRLAQTLFEKHFNDQIQIPVYYLPSTSPAHASLSPAQKLEKWRAIGLRERNWC